MYLDDVNGFSYSSSDVCFKILVILAVKFFSVINLTSRKYLYMLVVEYLIKQRKSFAVQVLSSLLILLISEERQTGQEPG